MLYVLDQNYLRSDELINLIAMEPRSKFVVPDVALLEMLKSENWEKIMLRSLKTLSTCPGRVFCSLSIGEGLKYELEKATSIEGKLLPLEFRVQIREILKSVASGASNKAINIIRESILDVQRDINQSELNHLNNQRCLLRRVETIESALSKEELKELRAGRTNRQDRLKFAEKLSFELCSSFLKEEKLFSSNKILMFLRKKPLLLRFYYINILHGIDWVARGGISTMRPERITNDILDQEYVLIGSFFDRLLTMETTVQESNVNLRSILGNAVI